MIGLPLRELVGRSAAHERPRCLPVKLKDLFCGGRLEGMKANSYTTFSILRIVHNLFTSALGNDCGWRKLGTQKKCFLVARYRSRSKRLAHPRCSFEKYIL